MTGGAEKEERGIPEKVKEAMVLFDVDEKRARQLIGFSSILSSQTVAKWKALQRSILQRKASEVLDLLEKAKNGDKTALTEAEFKLQTILKTERWER